MSPVKFSDMEDLEEGEIYEEKSPVSKKRKCSSEQSKRKKYPPINLVIPEPPSKNSPKPHIYKSHQKPSVIKEKKKYDVQENWTVKKGSFMDMSCSKSFQDEHTIKKVSPSRGSNNKLSRDFNHSNLSNKSSTSRAICDAFDSNRGKKKFKNNSIGSASCSNQYGHTFNTNDEPSYEELLDQYKSIRSEHPRLPSTLSARFTQRMTKPNEPTKIAHSKSSSVKRKTATPQFKPNKRQAVHSNSTGSSTSKIAAPAEKKVVVEKKEPVAAKYNEDNDYLELLRRNALAWCAKLPPPGPTETKNEENTTPIPPVESLGFPSTEDNYDVVDMEVCPNEDSCGTVEVESPPFDDSIIEIPREVVPELVDIEEEENEEEEQVLRAKLLLALNQHNEPAENDIENTFEDENDDNTFKDKNDGNTFKGENDENTFKDENDENTFKDENDENTFKDENDKNTSEYKNNLENNFVDKNINSNLIVISNQDTEPLVHSIDVPAKEEELKSKSSEENFLFQSVQNTLENSLEAVAESAFDPDVPEMPQLTISSEYAVASNILVNGGLKNTPKPEEIISRAENFIYNCQNPNSENDVNDIVTSEMSNGVTFEKVMETVAVEITFNVPTQTIPNNTVTEDNKIDPKVQPLTAQQMLSVTCHSNNLSSRKVQLTKRKPLPFLPQEPVKPLVIQFRKDSSESELDSDEEKPENPILASLERLIESAKHKSEALAPQEAKKVAPAPKKLTTAEASVSINPYLKKLSLVYNTYHEETQLCSRLKTVANKRKSAFIASQTQVMRLRTDLINAEKVKNIHQKAMFTANTRVSDIQKSLTNRKEFIMKMETDTTRVGVQLYGPNYVLPNMNSPFRFQNKPISF